MGFSFKLSDLGFLDPGIGAIIAGASRLGSTPFGNDILEEIGAPAPPKLNNIEDFNNLIKNLPKKAGEAIGAKEGESFGDNALGQLFGPGVLPEAFRSKGVDLLKSGASGFGSGFAQGAGEAVNENPFTVGRVVNPQAAAVTQTAINQGMGGNTIASQKPTNRQAIMANLPEILRLASSITGGGEEEQRSQIPQQGAIGQILQGIGPGPSNRPIGGGFAFGRGGQLSSPAVRGIFG